MLDTRDVGLLPAHQEPVTAPLHGCREVVRVRARVGLGDREGDLCGARRDAAEPALLLLVRPVPSEDVSDDRRRDHDQEQRLAGCGDLLAHGGEPAHAEPAPAPLLGQVHAEVALFGERVPELGRWLVRLVLLARVVLGEAVADAAHRLADLALLVRRHQREHGLGRGGRHTPIMPARAIQTA
jgi:hypothetical protein